MREDGVMLKPSFMKQAMLLPKDAKAKLLKCVYLLCENVRHPGLQTKRVRGTTDPLFECRVDQDIRLIYDNASGLLRCWFVGNHDEALKFAEISRISVDDIDVLQDSNINLRSFNDEYDEGFFTLILPALENLLL